VSRGSRTLFEYYGVGRGRKLGRVARQGHVRPDGAARSALGDQEFGRHALWHRLADGKVPAPEARLYDQFPEYPDLAKQPGRDRITVAHVLSMTMGIEWDELTFPYGDPRNSEIMMEAAPDRYRYILSLPIVGEPGVKWTYCGGATALLGRLIARAPGRSSRTMRGACCSIRSGWDRPNGRRMQGEPRAASGGRMRRLTFCASARWCWPTAHGRANRSSRRTG